MSEQTAKFSLGQMVATPNALAQIPNDEILLALSRHVRGDWGTLDKEDLESNERALQRGGRLFSSYHSRLGERGGTPSTGMGWNDLDRMVKWREGGDETNTCDVRSCDAGGATDFGAENRMRRPAEFLFNAF